MASISSLSPEAKKGGAVGNNAASAKIVGEMLAEKAIAQGIESVVFDRGGFLYHGRVKALADGAREKGLKF
jgi:large subunit ribosomal protein L18